MDTLHAHSPFSPSPEDGRREPSRTTVALLLLGMVGIIVLLALLFFLNQSLRLDEAQSLWQTSRAPLDTIRLVAGDVHVPLYHLLLHFWRLFVGDSVVIARLLSLLFLAISIPATYALGALAYNRRVGLFAAFLMAVSPFMNWYGNEIRMYTLFTLLVVLNQYCFLRIFLHRSAGAWWGYFVTALLGIFSHYFFLLSLASQALFFIARRELFPRGSLKRFAAIALLLAVAYVPWLYVVQSTGTATNQQPLLEPPTTVNLFSTFAQFLFGFQDDHVNTIFLSLWPIGLVFAFVALRDRRKASPAGLYFLTTILASVAIAFAVSATVRPVFVSRYLSFTIPSLYLLLAAHLDAYAPRFRAVSKFALGALMLATLVVEVVSTATPVKENYRQAAEYLNGHVAPQDVVAVSAPFTVYPVEYYYRGPAPLETVPLWNRNQFGPIPSFSEDRLPSEVEQLTASHQNLWLLLSYDQGYEAQVKRYFDTHYQKIGERQFSSDLTLYEYKILYTEPYSVR